MSATPTNFEQIYEWDEEKMSYTLQEESNFPSIDGMIGTDENVSKVLKIISRTDTYSKKMNVLKVKSNLSFLFRGENGSGRKSIARCIARFLNRPLFIVKKIETHLPLCDRMIYPEIVCYGEPIIFIDKFDVYFRDSRTRSECKKDVFRYLEELNDTILILSVTGHSENDPVLAGSVTSTLDIDLPRRSDIFYHIEKFYFPDDRNEIQKINELVDELMVSKYSTFGTMNKFIARFVGFDNPVEETISRLRSLRKTVDAPQIPDETNNTVDHICRICEQGINDY